MKSSAWFLGTVAICLLIAGAVLQTEEGSTFPQSSVAPRHDGHSVFSPAVAAWEFLSSSTAPPVEAACNAVGRRCFAPAAMQNSYNISPLYGQGFPGTAKPIAALHPSQSPTTPNALTS